MLDVQRPVHPRSGRSLTNIAAVSASVHDNPSTSIHHRYQQLDLSYSSTQRILTKDLHFHAYKIQLTQEWKQADHRPVSYTHLDVYKRQDTLTVGEYVIQLVERSKHLTLTITQHEVVYKLAHHFHRDRRFASKTLGIKIIKEFVILLAQSEHLSIIHI